MTEENDAGQPGQARLPGFREEPDRHGWYGPPGGYQPGYPPPAYVRDTGVRAARRTSTWTAAALIAAVAATTGYLAHAMPASSSGGTTVGHATTKHAGTVHSGAPGTSGPVVTSGGSGAVAGRSSGGGDN